MTAVGQRNEETMTSDRKSTILENTAKSNRRRARAQRHRRTGTDAAGRCHQYSARLSFLQDTAKALLYRAGVILLAQSLIVCLETFRGWTREH